MTIEERRDSTRIRCFLGAEIRFGQSQVSRTCVVRELSQSGARLSIPQDVLLPHEFELFIPARNETFRATCAWRTDTEMGVSLEQDRRQPGRVDMALSLHELNDRLKRLQMHLLSGDGSGADVALDPSTNYTNGSRSIAS